MNRLQTKICQNCKQEFWIEPEDFIFYAKIQVPPPTFCPECRMVRRMAWRNERSLYKRKCDAPGHDEEIISIYSPGGYFKVYDHEYWRSDNWSPMEYGQDYNFSKNFFDQFKELMKNIPHQNLMVINDASSQYCNWITNTKNCYLSSRLHHTEDCLYATGAPYTKDSIDIQHARKCELCYECVNCIDCYKLSFAQYCEACTDSFFLYDCKNCQFCFGCVNLRNKKYCFFNEQLSENDYLKMIKEFNIGYRQMIELKNKFRELILKYPRKFANIIKSVGSIGNDLFMAKDCKYCFDSSNNIENCKYAFYAVDGVRDSYDITFVGLNAELCYEILAGRGSRILSTIFSLENTNAYYSFNCHNSHYLFACVGLRHKQYCILNKQYTKEQYEELVPKIIKHMNDMPYISKIPNPKSEFLNKSQNSNDQNVKQQEIVYRYGEFFPSELSPFAYNETVAQEYFPLTKEQAINKGYQWKEPEERNYQFSIYNYQLPDHIKDVKDSIINQIIQCAHYDIDKKQAICNEQCSTAFKIIPRELEFYRKMNLPIPRLCPNCRHYQRVKQRNPLKLWHRQCQCGGEKSDNGIYQNTIGHNHHGTEHCFNEFETTYAPERKEIVYCKACYQIEVV